MRRMRTISRARNARCEAMESVKSQGPQRSCVSPPPPPKRQKYEGPVEIDAEPLRCSTPQPQEQDGEDLDKSLEILGISHDSIRKLAI